MITKTEHQRLWNLRQAETRAGRVAGAPTANPVRSIRRERWALSHMHDAGQLSLAQWAAAVRLKKLIDRAQRPAETSFEFRSRTTTDPAEAAYTAILARMAAVDALTAAQGPAEWLNRQRVVRAAFEGEPSLASLVRLYCEGTRNVRRVNQILARACDALAEHWAAVDSGNFRAGLDSV